MEHRPGAPNTVTVVAFGARHENAEVQGQQNVEQENSNNIENTHEEKSRKFPIATTSYLNLPISLVRLQTSTFKTKINIFLF